jgi:hypothetical protein
MDPLSLSSAITALVSLFSGGGGNQTSNGLSQLDPRLVEQLLQTMQYQNNRLASVAPIHQAALAMATRMAPAYARAAMTGGGGMPSGSPSPAPQYSTMTGGPSPATRGSQTPAAALNTGNPADIYVDRGVLYINGRGYQIPGASTTPTTGPEDPDPYHHPTASNGQSSPVSDATQQFFMGNPGGAFVGGPSGGGGEQDWYGQMGKVKAY